MQPIGPIGDDVLGSTEAAIARVFSVKPRRLDPWPEPAWAVDPERGQASSPLILKELRDRASPDAARVLGVTTSDIFLPMLTFVFGQAQLGGNAALISLARLRQEFYGFPPDGPLFRERAAKEAIHELGHTFGLVHCLEERCAMSLSSNIQQVDSKSASFCAGCSIRIAEALDTEGSS